MSNAIRKRGKRSKQLKSFVLFGFLLTSILILVIAMVGRRDFGSTQKLILELLGPLQKVGTQLRGYGDGLQLKYQLLFKVHEENRLLREELQRYQEVNRQYREAVATNERLRRLLEFKDTLETPTLTARIVGKDPSLWFRTLTIDRGSSDGVQKAMPVVTVDGIVGQVINTSPHYAKVLLATDPNSAIDVLSQTTRSQGILKGTGSGAFQMHYVLKSVEIQEGDHVITSGLGGIFPKGLEVGVISKVSQSPRGMFQEIAIEPAVDFSQLEEVLIVLKENSLLEETFD